MMYSDKPLECLQTITEDGMINSVMGLCGESGEAIDIVKKWMAQGH